MIEVYTIGVYNSTEETYFKKLTDNKIDLFLDIRQRRGVRGSLYKYVNSKYLQARLSQLAIRYEYIKELAPTKEIRQKQIDADRVNGENKKKRQVLGDVFIEEYRKRILDRFDVRSLIESLKEKGAKRIVLFCVEEHAEACHRSIVAKSIADVLHTNVINL